MVKAILCIAVVLTLAAHACAQEKEEIRQQTTLTQSYDDIDGDMASLQNNITTIMITTIITTTITMLTTTIIMTIILVITVGVSFVAVPGVVNTSAVMIKKLWNLLRC